jgi:hypothetical protein
VQISGIQLQDNVTNYQVVHCIIPSSMRHGLVSISTKRFPRYRTLIYTDVVVPADLKFLIWAFALPASRFVDLVFGAVWTYRCKSPVFSSRTMSPIIRLFIVVPSESSKKACVDIGTALLQF